MLPYTIETTDQSNLRKVFTIGFSAFLGTVSTMPFERLKVLVQSKTNLHSKNLLDIHDIKNISQDILKKDGKMGFLYSLRIVCDRNITGLISKFYAFDYLIGLLPEKKDQNRDSLKELFEVLGVTFLSTTFTSIITNPTHVIATKIQTEPVGFEEKRLPLFIKLTELREKCGGHKIFLKGLASQLLFSNLLAASELAGFWYLSKYLDWRYPDSNFVSRTLLAVATASALSTLIWHPLDTLNIAKLSQTFQGQLQRSYLDISKEIIQQRGFGSFWKGLTLNVARNTIFNSIACYYLLKLSIDFQKAQRYQEMVQQEKANENQI
eukprot:TRINITY_DN2614_c0_g2_i2.p1 TRINITY_DN2614_c0_g2~~TRINITY_DN2614_c0_g2_i2.p1  ORF type:complete len:322 (+),score=13.92 TRINITY_DN2614_c0_g2_i2:48-1013(+)